MKSTWAIPVLTSIVILSLSFGQNAHAASIPLHPVPSSDCSLIGIWDFSTLTCTITTDLTGDSLLVFGDGITVDGNGHTTSTNPAVDADYAIHIFGSDATVKNFVITDYFRGINISADRATVMGNTISHTIREAITVQSLRYDNLITQNTITHSNERGIMLLPLSGRTTITENTISNNFREGIDAFFSDDNIIRGNILFENDRHQIYINHSENNQILENHVFLSGTSFAGDAGGIVLTFGQGHEVANNLIEKNHVGLVVVSDNSLIYNNQFLENSLSATTPSFTTGNAFNLPAPVGGNLWDVFDEPDEGCFDANGDGFCDDPFLFPHGQDNLPICSECESTAPTTPTDLIDFVEDLGLDNKVEGSLTASLKNAQDILDDNNPNNDESACGKIDAFINKVNAQESKKITAEQADSLRDAAESVKDNTGC